MYFWLGVKNFAKIESAKIRTDGFTVLVGPNNCGKSFLMQLVQGINGKIYEMLDENVLQCLLSDDKRTQKYIISKEIMGIIVEKINGKLQLEKENIVRK